MSTFAVQARFPLRQFNAVGSDGDPEWPPSPARLAAALLSAAHDIGRPDVAESLFAVPVVHVYAPRVGRRDVAFTHWVPVNNGLKDNKHGQPTGIIDTDQRFQSLAGEPADRGVILGSARDTVTWIFENQDDAVDTRALAEVARAVPYLGRPTSPVILEVIAGETAPPEGYVEWQPDIDGDTDLNIATPLFLEALIRREEERRRSEVTGSHPPLTVRPTARYRCIGGPGMVGVQQPEPAPASWRSLLHRARLVRFPAGRDPRQAVQASEAASIVSQLRAQMDELDFLVPVFGTVGHRDIPVLRGVVAAGRGPWRLTFATRGGLREETAKEPRELRSLPGLMRILTGVAREWTTLVPTQLSDGEIMHQLRDVASEHGARVDSDDVRVHQHGRAAPVPDVIEPSPGRHVSVRFSSAVAGPVKLDDVWLAPVGSTVTVNPRRR